MTLITLGIVPTIAWGEQVADTKGAVTQLEEVTVSSTRTEQPVTKVPNTVTVIPALRIEQEGARDMKDVLRNELDVAVRKAPARFSVGASTGRAGSEGINIRGLEGNQILILNDGIRVPNSFSYGPFSTGRGDYLEVDGIKSVEILRGPASFQFGSDGLAGAVSIRTLDPIDLIKTGRPAGGFVRAGYATVDRSWANTLGVAGTQGQWQGMLLGAYRKGHEADNRGNDNAQNINRTTPNPSDYNNRYLLGKVFFNINPAQQLRLTFETHDRKQDVEVYSARAVPPLMPNSTLDLVAHDKISRDRVSFGHYFNDVNAPGVQRTETIVYWQDAKVNQVTNEDRNVMVDRAYNNTYKGKTTGLSTLLESNVGGVINQRLTYGIDWSRANINGLSNGTVPSPGMTYPFKPFPDTVYTLGGGFLQDEIQQGAVNVTMGLRFDYYNLSPSSAGYGGGEPAKLKGRALTPRLGVVWQWMPELAPYGQFAKGYRAPTPDQVNNSFTNLAQGYTSVANPSLKPERAQSVELGFRGKVDNVRYSMAVFDNRYKEFISQEVVRGSGRPTDPIVYQYINLNNAHIRGVEVRTAWQITSLWQTNAGLAYAKGESEANGVKSPLNTVQPLKVVLGVRYDKTTWGGYATVVRSGGKSASTIAPSASRIEPFAPPSYTVLDLGVYWKEIRNLTINANLNNVFNSKYWRWSDVNGLAANNVARDAYTAPGRNAQASVRYDF